MKSPPFAPAYVHYTQRLSRHVSALSRVMALADAGDLTGLSWDPVKGIVQKHLQHDYGQLRLKALKYLAVDEIYVGKRKKFYPLVLDLETGRIAWVGHGRGQAAPGKFCRRLRLSKVRIEAVAMDMSGDYWAAVLEHLPGAAVVFDRFHPLKLMNEKLDQLRRALVREAMGARPVPTTQAESFLTVCEVTSVGTIQLGFSGLTECGLNPKHGP